MYTSTQGLQFNANQNQYITTEIFAKGTSALTGDNVGSGQPGQWSQYVSIRSMVLRFTSPMSTLLLPLL